LCLAYATAFLSRRGGLSWYSSSLSILSRPPSSTLFPYTTLFRSQLGPGRRPAGSAHPARPVRGLVPSCGGAGGPAGHGSPALGRSEEHTSELQSRFDLVCRLLLETKKDQETRRGGRYT